MEKLLAVIANKVGQEIAGPIIPVSKVSYDDTILPSTVIVWLTHSPVIELNITVEALLFLGPLPSPSTWLLKSNPDCSRVSKAYTVNQPLHVILILNGSQIIVGFSTVRLRFRPSHSNVNKVKVIKETDSQWVESCKKKKK